MKIKPKKESKTKIFVEILNKQMFFPTIFENENTL